MKKMTLNELGENITALQKEGTSESTIVKVLGLDDPKLLKNLGIKGEGDGLVEEFIQRYEREKELLDLDEVVEMCKNKVEKKEVWNKSKIYTLVHSGELKPYNSNEPKKMGRKFHISEVERFIEERNMTLEDWKAQADKWKKLYLESIGQPEKKEEIPAGQTSIDDYENEKTN